MGHGGQHRHGFGALLSAAVGHVDRLVDAQHGLGMVERLEFRPRPSSLLKDMDAAFLCVECKRMCQGGLSFNGKLGQASVEVTVIVAVTIKKAIANRMRWLT